MYVLSGWLLAEHLFSAEHRLRNPGLRDKFIQDNVHGQSLVLPVECCLVICGGVEFIQPPSIDIEANAPVLVQTVYLCTEHKYK